MTPYRTHPGHGVPLSWDLIGLIAALGGLALMVALPLRRERSNLLVLALLFLAGILVTAENLHLHNDQSLCKHDDFGVWFTPIAANVQLPRRRAYPPDYNIGISIATVAHCRDRLVWQPLQRADDSG